MTTRGIQTRVPPRMLIRSTRPLVTARGVLPGDMHSSPTDGTGRPSMVTSDGAGGKQWWEFLGTSDLGQWGKYVVAPPDADPILQPNVRYRTYAEARLAAAADGHGDGNRTNILVFPGTYDEPLRLSPGIGVKGLSPDPMNCAVRFTGGLVPYDDEEPGRYAVRGITFADPDPLSGDWTAFFAMFAVAYRLSVRDCVFESAANQCFYAEIAEGEIDILDCVFQQTTPTVFDETISVFTADPARTVLRVKRSRVELIDADGSSVNALSTDASFLVDGCDFDAGVNASKGGTIRNSGLRVLSTAGAGATAVRTYDTDLRIDVLSTKLVNERGTGTIVSDNVYVAPGCVQIGGVRGANATTTQAQYGTHVIDKLKYGAAFGVPIVAGTITAAQCAHHYVVDTTGEAGPVTFNFPLGGSWPDGEPCYIQNLEGGAQDLEVVTSINGIAGPHTVAPGEVIRLAYDVDLVSFLKLQ